MRSVNEFVIPQELAQHGISRIAREGSTIIIEYKTLPVRFDIIYDKKTGALQKTIKNFEAFAKPVIRDLATRQAIIFYVSREWMSIIDGCISNEKVNTAIRRIVTVCLE